MLQSRNLPLFPNQPHHEINFCVCALQAFGPKVFLSSLFASSRSIMSNHSKESSDDQPDLALVPLVTTEKTSSRDSETLPPITNMLWNLAHGDSTAGKSDRSEIECDARVAFSSSISATHPFPTFPFAIPMAARVPFPTPQTTPPPLSSAACSLSILADIADETLLDLGRRGRGRPRGRPRGSRSRGSRPRGRGSRGGRRVTHHDTAATSSTKSCVVSLKLDSSDTESVHEDAGEEDTSTEQQQSNLESSSDFQVLTLKLHSSRLWSQFHCKPNEMILTKGGRCLFPSIKWDMTLASPDDDESSLPKLYLDPKRFYCFALDIVPCSPIRLRFQDGAWNSEGIITETAGPMPCPSVLGMPNVDFRTGSYSLYVSDIGIAKARSTSLSSNLFTHLEN